MISKFMYQLKLLTGPIFLFLFAMLIFNYPIIAALLLGPIILLISILWGMMLLRFERFKHQNINVTSFEERMYSNGSPNFSNIRIYLNKNIKDNWS